MPYRDPEVGRARRKAYYHSDPQRFIDKTAAWAKANPAQAKFLKARAHIMTEYGLDRQQAEVALVSRQGDFCRGCRRYAKMDIDHDHVTGRARGLLCRRCNIIAGALEDPKRPAVEAYLRGQ